MWFSLLRFELSRIATATAFLFARSIRAYIYMFYRFVRDFARMQIRIYVYVDTCSYTISANEFIPNLIVS